MSKRRRTAPAIDDESPGSTPSSSPSSSQQAPRTARSGARSGSTHISLDEFERLEGIEDPDFVDNSAPRAGPMASGVSEDEFVPQGASVSEDDVVQVIIKNAIARAMTDRVIKRINLREGLKTTRPFPEALAKANAVLKEYFGLNLEEQTDTSADGKSNVSYLLVSSLDTKERDILDKLWIDTSEVPQNSARTRTEPNYFLPKNKRDKLPGDNGYLVKMGVVSIILSVVVIEGNHINRKKLLEVLATFGFSVANENKNSNIDHTVPSLLQDLERTRYLKKAFNNVNNQVTTEPLNDAHVFYTLGSRALVDFSPLSFFHYIRGIYGDDFSDDVKNKTIATLKTAFDQTLSDELEDDQEPTPDEQNHEPPASGE